MKRYILRLVIAMFMLFSACIGGLMMWVAADTTESAETAEEFLAHLALRQPHEAYALTSALFRAEQTEERFTEVIETVLFLDYELQSWRDRTLERGDASQLRGTMKDDFGINIPISIDMAKDGGEWRVLSLTGPVRTGLGPGAWFQTIPNEPELQRMLKEVFIEFIQGVEDGDFTAFYNDIMSKAFHIRRPLFDLQRGYRHFVDKEIDISAVKDVDAVLDGVQAFEPNAVLGNLLLIDGYYPITPLPVHFRFRFNWQHPEWKLDGVLVDEPDPVLLTPSQCMSWLVAEGEVDVSRCFAEGLTNREKTEGQTTP